MSEGKVVVRKRRRALVDGGEEDYWLVVKVGARGEFEHIFENCDSRVEAEVLAAERNGWKQERLFGGISGGD